LWWDRQFSTWEATFDGNVMSVPMVPNFRFFPFGKVTVILKINNNL